MIVKDYIYAEYGDCAENERRCLEKIRIRECVGARRTLYHGSIKDLQEVMSATDTLSEGDKYGSSVNVKHISQFIIVEMRVDPIDVRDLPIWNKSKLLHVI